MILYQKELFNTDVFVRICESPDQVLHLVISDNDKEIDELKTVFIAKAKSLYELPKIINSLEEKMNKIEMILEWNWQLKL